MITRANRRKHINLHRDHIYRILTEVNREAPEEAARMADYVAKSVVEDHVGARRYISHAESYGEMYWFHRHRPRDSEFNYAYRDPILCDYNPYEKEWEIKEAWRQDNQEILQKIEKEVWGDLVSKRPKKVWP